LTTTTKVPLAGTSKENAVVPVLLTPASAA